MHGTPTRNPDPWWSMLSLSAVIIVPALLLVQSARGGNTTCASAQLDWYTSVVGESPCMTYQRLRQICNNNYQVPVFSSTVPGDRCDDVSGQSGCCCNTIAFQLSMLCLNCQQDTQDGDAGIDAPEKGYSVYMDSCSPVFNHTLPDNIQSTVCTESIRLDDFLYNGWDNGAWFYLFTKENAERTHAAENNNTFTHCANQTSSSLAPAPTSISTLSFDTTTPVQPSNTNTNTVPSRAPESKSKSKARASLIGGAVTGGVMALAIVVVGIIAVIRRRRKASGRGLQQISDSSDRLNLSYESSPPRPPPPPAVSMQRGPVLPNGLGVDSNGTAPALNSNRAAVSGILEIGTAGVSLPVAPNAPNLPSSVDRNETPLRHDDGGPLTMPELIRSSSGRLPPAYDDSWDGDPGRRGRAHRSSTGAAGGGQRRTRRGRGPLQLATTNGNGPGAAAMFYSQPSSGSIGDLGALPGSKGG